MKKMHVVFMFVAAVSAASQAKVWSEERARELPGYENVRASLRDLDGFRDRVRRERPVESAQPQEAVRTETPACEAFALDGAQMRAKVFSTDTEITAPGGQLLATLSYEGGSLVLRNAAGGRMASAVVKSTREGETAVISGCDGKALGSIEMAEDMGGDRSFVIKAADGSELARSGDIGYLQSAFSVKGAGMSVSYRSNHWFYDSYLVSVTGEGRIAAYLMTLNSSANRHESARRRHDHRHGRGDR